MKGKKNISDYASYFNMQLPGSTALVAIFIVLGLIVGIISSIATNYGNLNSVVLLNGASTGVIVVTIPAILAAIFFKSIRRKLHIKHALFATLIATSIYSILIIIDVILFAFLRSSVLEYVILILANAAVYGYWFVVGKMVVGQRKSAALTSAFHPIVNVLFYLLLGEYLLNIRLPLNQALIKLYGGMIVFLVLGYVSIYLIERPGKKTLDTRPVEIFSLMSEQWLYNITKNQSPMLAKGTKREIRVNLLLLKGSKNKTVFVMPDLHYGPFAGVGGGLLPERLGSLVYNKYGAVPFIMHGAVNIDDNPLYMHQIEEMEDKISDNLDKMLKTGSKAAYGSASFGLSGRCHVADITINGSHVTLLSKAPYVTEDISRDVGKRLEGTVYLRGKQVFLVDSHNSRFESAPEDELRGVYDGSKYEAMYADAIKKALSKSVRAGRLKFGSSTIKLGGVLKRHDLGSGYTSAGVFDFGGRRFCIIYFDANNMLPGFRSSIISYIKKNFDMDSEVCTSDTHSVNTIAMSAMNSLGRYTDERDIYPHVHRLVSDAIANMEQVKASSRTLFIEDFYTWGEHSFENILKMAEDIGKVIRHVIPFIIAAAFIIAAWVIYTI